MPPTLRTRLFLSDMQAVDAVGTMVAIMPAADMTLRIHAVAPRHSTGTYIIITVPDMGTGSFISACMCLMGLMKSWKPNMGSVVSRTRASSLVVTLAGQRQP